MGALWFHLRIGRKYWKISVSQDKFFIKGALITSLPKILPRKFIDDLPDRRPLKWFSFVKILLYLKYDAIILK